jgi:hypothetical protein
MLEIDLIFIVNGEDVLVTTSLLAPMDAARNEALLKSHNTGRPLKEWEIRNERGALVDPTRTVNSHGLKPNSRFFLTLPVGLGGALAA